MSGDETESNDEKVSGRIQKAIRELASKGLIQTACGAAKAVGDGIGSLVDMVVKAVIGESHSDPGDSKISTSSEQFHA